MLSVTDAADVTNVTLLSLVPLQNRKGMAIIKREAAGRRRSVTQQVIN